MRTSGTSALQPDSRFSVADYKSWTDDVRRELIGGVVYDMSPAPRIGHQELAGEIHGSLKAWLKDKPCKAFIAPVDVYLFPELADEDDYDVVQPDLLVACDRAKIRNDGIHGAPDLVVEVLSPSTSHKDMGDKRDLYERAGVREYWVVNPDNGRVFVWRLDGGAYAPVAEYAEGAEVPSAALPGFSWMAVRAPNYG